nr:hypothetical protein [Tanacetum cinerariifolium]
AGVAVVARAAPRGRHRAGAVWRVPERAPALGGLPQ